MKEEERERGRMQEIAASSMLNKNYGHEKLCKLLIFGKVLRFLIFPRHKYL